MNDHLIRGGLAGREGLRALGRVYQPTTLPLLERAGVGPGLLSRRRLRRRRQPRPRPAEEVDRLVAVLYDVARDPTTHVGNSRVVQVWGDRPGP